MDAWGVGGPLWGVERTARCAGSRGGSGGGVVAVVVVVEKTRSCNG